MCLMIPSIWTRGSNKQAWRYPYPVPSGAVLLRMPFAHFGCMLAVAVRAYLAIAILSIAPKARVLAPRDCTNCYRGRISLEGLRGDG